MFSVEGEGSRAGCKGVDSYVEIVFYCTHTEGEGAVMN